MDKVYEPNKVEPEILAFWQQNKYFNKTKTDSGLKYVTVSPPPNVTGVIHVGHALNNTIQDILVRAKRMEGYEVSWLPGLDHASIATEFVVERHLTKEGRNKRQMTRAQFLEEVHKWVDTHKGIIVSQLQRMGCSCDWDRLRFTMDPDHSALVRETFVRLYERGLIYKGNYLTNHCGKCGTALADDEVTTETVPGSLYHVRYLVEGTNPPEYLVVATTRPETIFGDTAVAVHPDDPRYTHLHGARCVVPIGGRSVPIVTDPSISRDFGTGAMKVTPAHDKADFQLGRTHGLETINLVDRENRLLSDFQTQGSDSFVGVLHTLVPAVVKFLERNGSLERTEPYDTLRKGCYRCGSPIENVISEQWYVRMKPLAEKIRDLDGLRFFPEHQRTVYLNWLDNITDWCISRQKVYSHEIPVWYCLGSDCGHVNVSVTDVVTCGRCGGTALRKDPDVLDTWFSSWLWCVPTGPLDVIVTGSDILFFWITRMIMASVELKAEIPFRDILLHGIVRDKKGKKMAKTVGNVIDPLEVINKYGTDALRFSLMFTAPAGRDLRIDLQVFQIGRSLATKLWNAGRFLLMKADAVVPAVPSPSMVSLNEEILGKVPLTRGKVRRHLEEYDLHGYSRTMYSFLWDDFCGHYLERTKTDHSETCYRVLCSVYLSILKLFHPIIPFITERIYQELKGSGKVTYNFHQSIMTDSPFDVSAGASAGTSAGVCAGESAGTSSGACAGACAGESAGAGVGTSAGVWAGGSAGACAGESAD